MGLEAEFRRAFEKSLRRHTPLLAYMSSMNRAGVPDEYLIVDGRSIWIELKAVDKWAVKEVSNSLGHRFSGPQLAFMRKVDDAGGRSFGVVGWRRESKWVCAAIRVHNIGDDGTLSRLQINRHVAFDVDAYFHVRFLDMIKRS